MTKIIFSFINHGPPPHNVCIDICNPFIEAFKKMGYEVEVDHENYRTDGFVVYLECFDNNYFAREIFNNESKYAIIQSELETPYTFNNHFSFQNRHFNFHQLAKKAQFVINLVGGTDVPCPSFKCDNAYIDTLEFLENNHLIEYDVLFFGTYSARRHEILQKLTDAGIKVLFSNNEPTKERNESIQKVKWVLGLKPHWDNVSYPSLTRISTSLLAKRPVLNEYVEKLDGIGSIPLIHDNKSDFIEWAIKTIKNDNLWKSEQKRQVQELYRFPILEQLQTALKAKNIVI